jgi:hypothetical protein
MVLSYKFIKLAIAVYVVKFRRTILFIESSNYISEKEIRNFILIQTNDHRAAIF